VIQIRRASAMPLCLVFALILSGSFRFPVQAGSLRQTNAPQVSGFQVVRSVSGSVGSMQGDQFVIADAREVFHVPDDKQVFVFFEWDGTAGSHHLEGTWKDPTGKNLSTANLDAVAKTSRFSAYWELTLSPGMTPGLWALEIKIDGQPAGTHSFQVVSGSHDSPPLDPGQIYKQALSASVFIDNLDRDGSLLSKGSGFFISDGVVLTAFHNINGASSLTLELPGGGRGSVSGIIAWNRLQDWAKLKVDSAKAQSLMRAAAGSWNVGDTCYVIDSPDEDSRSIQTVSISGIRDSNKIGQRLDLSWSGSDAVQALLCWTPTAK
jgi:S1-C subfamily serine protease